MNSFKKLITISIFILLMNDAYSQISPMGASFFQNQYLNNPALAGFERGLNANISYRQQFNSVPGAPVNQTLTVEYGSNKNAGFGLNIYNDKAGLFKTTRVLGSYSYAVRFNDEKRLQFGLSLGFLNQRISNEDVDGDPNDFQLAEFTKRETYIDGDFGIAYTDNKFLVQLAIPQLKNQLGKDKPNLVNYPTFFSSIGYKFVLEDLATEAEPKINYRGVKGSDKIVDVGLNLAFADRRMNVFGLYHSSESFSFGFGIKHSNISISGIYATGTSVIRNYANGDFEINLGVKF